MNYLEHAKEGLLNLYYAKLRAFLALLGILVGTASVVTMVLGGELATQEALAQFKSLGTDLLAVTVNTSMDKEHQTDGKTQPLSLRDVLHLAQADQHILQIAPYTQLFLPTFYQGVSLNAMLLGVTDRFADIVQIKLQKGRLITLADHYQFYCVIGHEVYNALKQIYLHDPIGEQLQIGKHIFVIVGVAAPWPENSFVYANIDHSILIPIEASMAINQYATINNMIMRLTADADIEIVEKNILAKSDESMANKQVNFRSAKELIAKMQKQSSILSVFLGMIGSVSLIVGGIGVMNIMLVSVTERRREIGIRMAVGATPFDISMLFLLEAIMLSVVGGVLGVIIGIMITYIIAIIWHWPFTLFLWPPIAGFSVSVAVGIFFGFYPAYLAAKLDPIEALRSD